MKVNTSTKKPKVVAYCYDKKGRLLSIGTNSYTKTHPIQKHFACISGLPQKEYTHAEIDALLRCKTKIPYSLHVERYKRDGSPALARPCPVCMAAIKAWNVQKVTFTEG